MDNNFIANLAHRLNMHLYDNRERIETLVRQFQTEYPWHPSHPGYTLQVRAEEDYVYVEWVAYKHSRIYKRVIYGKRHKALPRAFWKTRSSEVKERFMEYQNAANYLRKERERLMEIRRKVLRLLKRLPEPAVVNIRPISDYDKKLRRQATKDRLTLRQPHV